MKRSDFFIRLMTGIIFIAVAVYGCVIIYDTIVNPYETTVATVLTIEEVFKAQGYIVRTEYVLPGFSPSVLPVVREGEKVASGQAIAIEYTSPGALETAAEIRWLTMKIAGLTASNTGDEAVRRSAVVDLAAAVHTHNLRRLDEIVLNLETSIFSAGSGLEELQARLDELQSRSAGAKTLYAPQSGNFSMAVDGFEHITPDTVREMIPSDLHAHFKTPAETSGTVKLVTAFRWYYVAEVNYNDALNFSAGDIKTLQFSGSYQAQHDMLIESVSRRENDTCVVIFSSNRSIHEVASLRFLRADIINNIHTGLRIPKEAVRLETVGDELAEFIYLQTSGYAERVRIERIPQGNPFETSDSYLVRDGLETGSPLRAGSTIIVRANDLYHGKVVG